MVSKSKIWNGRTVSAEYFTDAVLGKFDKSPQFIRQYSIVLEIGKNNFNVSAEDYEGVGTLEISGRFENFLRILGRYFNFQKFRTNDKSLINIFYSLYEFGYNTTINQLYPAINFPVSRRTPMLSSKILWNHNEIYKSLKPPRRHIYQKSFTIDLRKQDWNFIVGHTINGKSYQMNSNSLCLCYYLLLYHTVKQPLFKLLALVPFIVFML